jgi:hypothetical protein
LRSCGRFSLDYWAWVFLPIYGGFGFGFLGGRFANWLIWKIYGATLLNLPILAGMAIAAVGILPAGWLYRGFTTRRTEMHMDVAKRQVEVIEVK